MPFVAAIYKNKHFRFTGEKILANIHITNRRPLAGIAVQTVPGMYSFQFLGGKKNENLFA
jgi:hypothetical protein